MEEGLWREGKVGYQEASRVCTVERVVVEPASWSSWGSVGTQYCASEELEKGQGEQRVIKPPRWSCSVGFTIKLRDRIE